MGRRTGRGAVVLVIVVIVALRHPCKSPAESRSSVKGNNELGFQGFELATRRGEAYCLHVGAQSLPRSANDFRRRALESGAKTIKMHASRLRRRAEGRRARRGNLERTFWGKGGVGQVMAEGPESTEKQNILAVSQTNVFAALPGRRTMPEVEVPLVFNNNTQVLIFRL